LLRTDGRRWRESDPSIDYRRGAIAAVEAAGLDKGTTLYSLRHSSICRALLANVPVRVVAALHDTSISQIERNYSRFIDQVADDVARGALLHEPAPANVAVLARR
jgi:hypothetical protein